MATPRSRRPLVGLVYNDAMPALLAHAPRLVEHLAAVPDRLWFDFGRGAPAGRRFRTRPAIDELLRHRARRNIVGHGLGLALASARPLDETMLAAVAAISQRVGGFAWYSEHVNLFVGPHGSAPDSPAGLGLPVAHGEELLALMAPKLRALAGRLGCRVLLENGTCFVPMAEPEMDEPAFFNALHRRGLAGMLLDLHNLYVNQHHRGADARVYLDALDPAAVEEVHLAGGDRQLGFYADTHSALTPLEVWQWAFDFLPRCPNLRAITFEIQEASVNAVGVDALARELERMHELAAACAVPVRELAHAE